MTSANDGYKTIIALTWNAEGLKSSIFALKEFLEENDPDLVFISESQTFQTDIKPILQPINHEYDFFLNSDDLHSPESTSNHSVSYGGTLVLWRRVLGPSLTIFPVETPAFTPLILKLPGFAVSVHIALYLPTRGRDSEFFHEIANLRLCLIDIQEKHPGCIFFLRGDSNVNHNNIKRVSVLKQLMSDFKLTMVNITHNTYHHFVGNGKFDSSLDVLIHSKTQNVKEEVLEIICKISQPLVLSHHDVILSKATIPSQPFKEVECVPPSKAPRLSNTRHKILWSDHGIEKYRAMLEPQLKVIQEIFIDSSSVDSMAVALQLTNFALTNTATLSNRALSSSRRGKEKQSVTPPFIIKAKSDLQRAHKKLKRRKTEINIIAYKQAQKSYRKAVKRWRICDSIRRDQRLYTIMSDNPADIFKFLRGNKTASKEIRELKVGNQIYSGDSIPDGFYESMRNIKSCDLSQLRSDENLMDHFSIHQHILKICEHTPKLPLLTVTVAMDLLGRLKKDVRDYFCVTARHYLNAGDEGIQHFCLLLNTIIQNENIAALSELNTTHGLILYKGHNKDANSDRSYRTISTCPFLSKALDLYIRDLYHQRWDQAQALTQYQGAGSSHELAALLITEVVQYSLYVKNRPVFLLSLDAQSAFDRCLREIVIEPELVGQQYR